MYELFYCSYAPEEIKKEDILDILDSSRKNNESLGVTGILVYHKKTKQFMQILEGEEAIVIDLYSKIAKDPRHMALKIIHQGEIGERGFKGWSMAFKDLQEIDVKKMEGLSQFVEQGFTDERTPVEPSTSTKLIDSFRSFLP